MDKKEAQEILEQLDVCGKKCGYKDITVTAHVFADLERFLSLFPENDSSASDQIKDFKLIVEALKIDMGGFRV